jgi:putative acetyltransferase
MVIRKETESDFDRIYDVVKTAFQTAKVSDGKEQDFVTQLRSAGGYIPELALVAEEGDALLGHIMLTRTHIVDGPDRHEILLLAPLAVALDHRSRGLGAQLIGESCRRAKAMGFSAVILVGDPGYYGRFGFRTSADFGIRNTNDIPDEYVMVCELVPGALQNVQGTILFSTAA